MPSSNWQEFESRLRRLESLTPTNRPVDSGNSLDEAFSLPPPSAKFIRSTTQAIPNNAWTAVNWEGNAPPDGFDEGGIVMAGANSSLITVPAGLWLTGTLVRWGVNSSGIRQIAIDEDQNLTASDIKGAVGAFPSEPVKQSANELVYFSEQRNVRVLVYQNSGADLDSSDNYLWFLRLHGGSLK